MNFTISREQDTSAIKFAGEITQRDLDRVRLDCIDCMLLRDVGGDASATAADYLLALEMLLRRCEEQPEINTNGIDAICKMK